MLRHLIKTWNIVPLSSLLYYSVTSSLPCCLEIVTSNCPIKSCKYITFNATNITIECKAKDKIHQARQLEHFLQYQNKQDIIQQYGWFLNETSLKVMILIKSNSVSNVVKSMVFIAKSKIRMSHTFDFYLTTMAARMYHKLQIVTLLLELSPNNFVL